MRARKKSWAEPYLEAHGELVIEEIDASSDFFLSSPKYLEIGIGKGDFILGMASGHPGCYLGLERDSNVLAVAAKKVVEASFENRIHLMLVDFDDAYEALSQLKFDVIFLNFSDPWPKKRHWKRRLTERKRLANIASLLEEGGEIRIKTDNPSLYQFTLEEAEADGLDIVLSDENYEFDSAHDAMSEYESRFRGLGNPIYRIILKKKGE